MKKNIKVVGYCNGERFLIIFDAEQGSYFKIGELGYLILGYLNKNYSLQKIKKRIYSKYKKKISSQELKVFIRILNEYGLIEKTKNITFTENFKQRSFLGVVFRTFNRFLYIKMKIISIDSFITSIEPKIKIIFSRGFLVVLCICFLANSFWLFNNSEIFFQQFKNIWLFDGSFIKGIMLLIFMNFPILLIHELSHAITCKYFGGKVGEIGILLIFFQPFFYCNITNTWGIPRNKRILIRLSGLLSHIVFLNIFTPLVIFIPPDSWLYEIGWKIIIWIWMLNLFNLNPFWKVDGYYLLIDLLNTPNLYENSFKYLFLFIKKRLFKKKEVNDKYFILETYPRRIKTIFILYSIFSIIFTMFFLYLFLKFLISFIK